MEYKQFYTNEMEESLDLVFNISMVNSHHGQDDFILTASQLGKIVGKIEFSVFQDMPYINWIEVADDKRRSGIGKQMIQRLQKEYPESEIKVGGTTDLGTKFFSKLSKSFEKNPQFDVLTKKLNALKNAERRLIAYVEKTGNTSERLTNLFNKISDEMWETEEKLKDTNPGKTKFTEMAYPLQWDIDKFKALKSFSQRVKYCNENLQRLASGSSRIAYKVDEEKVLKLAKNRKGIAQNSVERDYYIHQAYDDIVAKVFDVDENDLWLEMELAKKLTPNRFKALVGFGVDFVGDYLSYKDRIDNGWKQTPTEFIKKMDDNEWIQRVYMLCREADLSVGDFGRISSYGEVIRNGKPAVVIIDLGLSKSVWNDFYGVN